MDSLMPKYRFKSVIDITVGDFRKMGAKAVALDIDNTICYDGTSEFIDGLFDWIKKMRSAEIKLIIISNAGAKRAKKVADELNIPFVARAKKPKTDKMIKSANDLGVDITEMAMVGDQLLSDIKGANRCGAIAVRVDPIRPETRFKYHFAYRRRKEAPIIAEFEKLYGYGVYDE